MACFSQKMMTRKAFKSAPTISTTNDKEKNVDMSIEYRPTTKNEIVQTMLNNQGSVSYTHLTLPTTPYV